MIGILIGLLAAEVWGWLCDATARCFPLRRDMKWLRGAGGVRCFVEKSFNCDGDITSALDDTYEDRVVSRLISVPLDGACMRCWIDPEKIDRLATNTEEILRRLAAMEVK